MAGPPSTDAHDLPPAVRDRLRGLPAVDRLASDVAAAEGGGVGEREATLVARATLEDRRAALLAGARDEPDLVERARARLRPSLRRVLNATGVVVHTGLGRAPLARAAREAVARVAEGYGNLELDLEDGARGSRHDHVEGLLRELTGAEAAMVVNNCAAAVLLAVAATATPPPPPGGRRSPRPPPQSRRACPGPPPLAPTRAAPPPGRART